MKFVLANWGTRGEVEPYVAVGRELVRRGHDVSMAVAPEMVGFVESAGPKGIAYGPDLRTILDPHRDFWMYFYGNAWKIRKLGKMWSELSEPLIQSREAVSATLSSLADGADVLLTGMNFEDTAANVAECYDLPLSTLHIFPVRANGQLVPLVPAPVGRSMMTLFEWLSWRGPKKAEDAQRRQLGLANSTAPWPQRIAERGSLEIQAYDEVCYPGLAAEWAKWGARRPFVGALTMGLSTDTDDEVASWIAAGSPPICFSFGSVGVESAADLLAMIATACAQLGERALICAAGTDFSDVADLDDHVLVVDMMNYGANLPGCRAFAHHGGAGTTNAGLRAGLPTLVLWTLPDQAAWGSRIKRLKAGTGRRFSATTRDSLVADLRTVLAPECLSRSRDLAAQMTQPADSIVVAADLLENFARLKCVG
jgi:UDP:flavonoid glycosyltransferase YjiC (YdhE family)